MCIPAQEPAQSTPRGVCPQPTPALHARRPAGPSCNGPRHLNAHKPRPDASDPLPHLSRPPSPSPVRSSLWRQPAAHGPGRGGRCTRAGRGSEDAAGGSDQEGAGNAAFVRMLIGRECFPRFTSRAQGGSWEACRTRSERTGSKNLQLRRGLFERGRNLGQLRRESESVRHGLVQSIRRV